MQYSEFRKKEVINIKNCEKLGRVTNLEIDESSGQICKIIVSGGSFLLPCLPGEAEYMIPYCHIRQIGPDLILVDIN